MGLSGSEILRCYDLATGFVGPAMDAVGSGELPHVSLDDIKLEAPVPRPSKIICIGLNYLDHVTESGAAIPKTPLIFSKFDTCVAASEDAILLPVGSEQVDFEAELAVVIGRRAKNIELEHAMDHVFGYTNFNDVSARDMQFADGQWQRGKSCDTFAPFGPFVATKDEIADPHKLRIQFRLNDATMQDSNTDQLIFRIPELIEYISRSITLEPGDIIATGTPPGVGFARKPPVFLKDGDVCEVEIEGLGILYNVVSAG
ncbi:MAG: fumarylacetoacetate hydrolase family protein [Acidobacteria bacterium]|nr:fumarylacetoacetate hydrolase family protein [Acidobacteriota bacterium]